MTTKQLTPELRRKVAEAVTGYGCVIDEDRVLVKYDPENWLMWRPLTYLPQKGQLIIALAGRIDSTPFEHIEDWIALSERFIHALATNNTSALESLFAEMLEEKG